MPDGYLQDVVTRIVNVQWGGAVWVLGDDAGQIWYGTVKTGSATEFQKVFTMGTTHDGVPPGRCNGGSSALVGADQTTAIVVGGHEHAFDHIDEGVEGGHFTIGKIMFSTNGTSWNTALDMPADLTRPTTVLKIIWDQADRHFYALASQGIAGGGSESKCFASADGRAWSEAGDNSTFESHCKYKDANGGGLADGEFGLDPARKGSHETFPLGEVVEDGLLITINDVDGSPISFRGGIWGRANHANVGELEVSTDDGNTWTGAGSIPPFDLALAQGMILALVAAPAKVANAGL